MVRLLIVAFLILRLGTLLTSVEYAAWDEELYSGSIAKDLIEGLKAPLWDYQLPRHGGTLVMGILVVPFFLLFGPNLFVLKMVPLLIALATLALTYLFLKRFFDRRVALFACALLVFPPPVFTELSLCAIGSHMQSLPFTAVCLLGLYHYLYGRENNRRPLVLLGLASGLGFWFAPVTFVTTLTCLVSWFLLKRRSFLSRDLLVFCLSFGAGAIPLIYFEATHGFGNSRFLLGTLRWAVSSISLGEKLVFFPTNLIRLVVEVLPFIFHFRSTLGIPSSLLALFYGGIALWLIAPFIWRERRKAKLVPILLLPFVYLLLYSATGFYLPEDFRPFHWPTEHNFIGLRYFSPLYYFLFLLLALSLSSHRHAMRFLCLLLGLGLVGQGSLLFHEPIGRALRYQGYSYLWLGDQWRKCYPFPEKFAEFQGLAARYQEPDRRLLYREYATSLFVEEEGAHAELGIVLQAIERMPKEYRSFFIEDLGYRLGLAGSDRLNEGLALGERLAPEEQPYFYFGLATGYSSQRPDVPYWPFYYFHLGKSVFQTLPSSEWTAAGMATPGVLGTKEKMWFHRGMGVEAASRWISLPDFVKPFDAVAAKFSSEVQAEFFWGVGWGLGAADLYADRVRTLDWIGRLEEKHQPWALKGFQEFEQWYGLATAP